MNEDLAASELFQKSDCPDLIQRTDFRCRHLRFEHLLPAVDWFGDQKPEGIHTIPVVIYPLADFSLLPQNIE